MRRSGAHIHFRVRWIGAGVRLDRKLVLIETAGNSRVEICVMASTLCLRTVNYFSAKSLISRQFPAGSPAAIQSGMDSSDSATYSKVEWRKVSIHSKGI